MTSKRFFIKQGNIQFHTVTLYGEEHHHLSRVARIRPGERVWLFDQRGRNYLARVEKIRKNGTELFIMERMDKDEPGIKITLAQALLKLSKMEIIIQKATELGVLTVIPVITSRTVVKIEEKTQEKMERWKRIAREAAKQSQGCLVPSISFPLPLARLLKEREDEKKLLLSENRGQYFRDILTQNPLCGASKEGPPSSVLILVGPEGGWTEEEEAKILSHGYQAVSLGRRILRAETAAICSLSLISHFWNP